MRKEKSIHAGQKFRSRAAWGGIWIVEHIYDSGYQIRHVRLRDSKGSDLRTLAASVLLDPARFEPIEEAAVH